MKDVRGVIYYSLGLLKNSFFINGLQRLVVAMTFMAVCTRHASLVFSFVERVPYQDYIPYLIKLSSTAW